MRAAAFLVFVTAAAGCAELSPFVTDMVNRALSAPGGLVASRSTNPSVHCTTNEGGRTDCYEYRLGGAVPLRDAGASARDAGATNEPAWVPPVLKPADYPNAPLAPAPEPLPTL